MTTPESFEKYLARPGINATALKAGALSMLHMREVMTGRGKPDTPSLKWGRIVHRAVLEPDKWKDSFAVYDGRRAGKKWEAFEAEHTGLEIVKPDQAAALEMLVDSVRSNADAARLLAGCTPEVTVTWQSERYGEAKARVDGLADDYSVEFKTTRAIKPESFERQCANLEYKIQLGWYSIGLGPRIKSQWVIAVENVRPFDCVVYRVDDQLIEVGRDKAIKLAERYRECERVRRFPGCQGEQGPRVLSLTSFEMESSELQPMEEMEAGEL